MRSGTRVPAARLIVALHVVGDCGCHLSIISTSSIQRRTPSSVRVMNV